MGLLKDDYWKNAAAEAQTAAPVVSSQPAEPQPAVSQPQVVQPGSDPLLNKNPVVDTAMRLGPLGVIGGAIGSLAGPVGTAAGALVGSSIGASIKYPDNWQELSTVEKIGFVGGQAISNTVRAVMGVPAELVRTPIRYSVSVAQPWVRTLQGKDASFKALREAPVLDLPLLGKVPTYYQSYDEAIKAGQGPLAATLSSAGTALGDAVLVGALSEAGARALQPRAPVVTPVGQASVQNTAPIRMQITRDSSNKAVSVARQGEGAVSEYYSLPKSTAQQFGGNTNNTFFKLTPASPTSVELSVVQTRGGAVQRGVDWLRGNKTYEGDFGPEVKVQSQIIEVNKPAMAETGASGPISIPSTAVKGMENKPVTMEQLDTLAKIGNANGVAPSVRDAVIRSVTGKTVMGEMTQAQYVKAAQTLGLFNNASKYVPKDAFLNPAAQYLSPQRRWMRTYEERSGVPLYSEAYVPLEDATRARDIFRQVWRGKARDVFGEFAGSGKAAERQAIHSYLQGNKGAIVGNTAFDASTQSAMVKVADDLRTLYNEVGPQMGVPPEIFLKDYQPHIQNIGGVYQLYKDGSNIPKAIDFFAKFKRKGNPTAPLVDDSLALFDIYVNAGSNSTFVTPVLERISALGERLPGTLSGSLKSYVQEKLGYAGRMEQAMDEMVPALNSKLGINLPPDTARQFGDVVLSTQYSGLLSQPATWFRQMFQYPLFGYSRLGPKFAGDAYKKALTREGLKEVSDAGFFVDLGYPYGGALAEEATLGGRVGNAYKTATQIPIAPNAAADNVQRAVVYHQFKMQFEDALSRYNSGKISWPAFEKEIDMSSFSRIDQNIARQRLVGGDVKGAFEHLVRDVIDETQFPYRKASTARVGYGFGGKVATSLLQWPMEASHTLGKWIAEGARTGDFTKLIRYFAASVAIQRTMQSAFDLDFTKSLYMGPVLTSTFVSPMVQLAGNTFGTIVNAPFLGPVGGANNRQKFNENAEAVMKTLKSAGMPAGLEIQNIRRFWKSIERGPDANGEYAALNDQGEVKYTTDFAGLFMGELMGFPTQEKVDSSKVLQDMRNSVEDRKTAKQKVMELLQQEKYDEASSIMGEFGIQLSPQDFDDYYIPLTQRNFQMLPASLKAQYAPRVFPDAFQGVQ